MNKQWEKEFDYDFHFNDGKLSKVNVHNSKETIKDRIQSLLSSQLSDLRKKVEGMKIYTAEGYTPVIKEVKLAQKVNKIYNQALDDVLKLIDTN